MCPLFGKMQVDFDSIQRLNLKFSQIKLDIANSIDASTVNLYCCHNPTTIQKNLHFNQKGVMNQLLASI